jgi:glycosyltransferase involved in cell wall biosynthesis
MTKRVLFVSYLFPPVGGAGVQRAAKFVKYLPSCGWLPSVLTVSNPSVPLFDPSLTAQVSPDVVIRRAPTWEPSYAVKNTVAGAGHTHGHRLAFMRRAIKTLARGLIQTLLQPDPQILWLPAAVREGLKLLREVRHQVIFATAPPFSAFLVGARLSRKTGLPLVLDYRDEWDICTAHWENRRPDFFSRTIQHHQQAQVLRQASAVLATTRSSAAVLAPLCRAAASKARVGYIYNGFDPDDFPPAPAADSTHAVFRLVYTGTLWNLSSIEPLVQAAREFARRFPELASRLEFVFAGRRTEKQQQFIDALKELPVRVKEHPYLDHQDALALLREADMSCIVLSDQPGVERIVPAKAFECMAARRPILAIAPSGELTELLAGYKGSHIFHPRETMALADFLGEQAHRFALEGAFAHVSWDGSSFSRRHAAQQLTELLDSCVPKSIPAAQALIT